MSVNLNEKLDEIIGQIDGFIGDLASLGFSPDNRKKDKRIYSVKKTEEMVGRSRKTLLQLHKSDMDDAEFFEPVKSKATGRAVGFTLKQINAMRDYYGTRPSRRPGEKAMVLTVQSFKGGVAKSVSCSHLAQWLALRGYRVLLIDCDPQASTTTSYGYIPDLMFNERSTLCPYLSGEESSLDYAIIESYFPGVDLVPSCLPLYEAEFGLFDSVAHEENPEMRTSYWLEFKNAIESVEDRYDIILLDPPPALGMISINVFSASDGVIVPVPPSLYDLSSARQYLEMLKRIVANMPDKELDFLKVMGTRVDPGKAKQKEFATLMQERLGNNMFRTLFKTITTIPAAATYFKTLFDITPQDRDDYQLRFDRETQVMVDEMFGEIEQLVHRAWGRTHIDELGETA